MLNSATELTHFCRTKSIALDLVLQKCVSSVAEFCMKSVFSSRDIIIFLAHHTLVPLVICFLEEGFFFHQCTYHEGYTVLERWG